MQWVWNLSSCSFQKCLTRLAPVVHWVVSSTLLVSSQCLALGTKSNIYEQNPTQSDSSALDYECDLKVTPSLCSSAQVAVTTPDRVQNSGLFCNGRWVGSCLQWWPTHVFRTLIRGDWNTETNDTFQRSVKLAHLPGQSVMTQTETESSCLQTWEPGLSSQEWRRTAAQGCSLISTVRFVTRVCPHITNSKENLLKIGKICVQAFFSFWI